MPVRAPRTTAAQRAWHIGGHELLVAIAVRDGAAVLPTGYAETADGLAEFDGGWFGGRNGDFITDHWPGGDVGPEVNQPVVGTA